MQAANAQRSGAAGTTASIAKQTPLYKSNEASSSGATTACTPRITPIATEDIKKEPDISPSSVVL